MQLMKSKICNFNFFGEATANLKSVYQSTADEIIVLAAFSSIHIEWRHSTPVIAGGDPKSHTFPTPGEIHVQPNSSLQHATGSAVVPGILAIKEKIAAGFEMSKTSAKTDPGRKREVGYQTQARGRSNEKRAVLVRNLVGEIVQVFVGIENGGYLDSEIEPLMIEHDSSIVKLEGKSCAVIDNGIREPRIEDALITDEGFAE